jgi:hypothetical protein
MLLFSLFLLLAVGALAGWLESSTVILMAERSILGLICEALLLAYALFTALFT